MALPIGQMRRVWNIGVVLSAVALTLRCGSGSSGGGGPSIPVGQLGDEFAAVVCHKIFTCCTASEISSTVGTVDEATCRSDMVANGSSSLLKSEVAGGLVIYHGDRARSCLDMVAALPCEQWALDDKLLRFPVCQTITEGTLATGTACAADDECSGGHCGSSTGASVCAAPAELGQSCTFAKCVPGLACRTDQSQSPGICGTTLPDGASCFDSNDCAIGYCISDGNGNGFCGLGATCNGI
jgi:hypothetical protein